MQKKWANGEKPTVGHEFDLAQLELQRRQIEKSSLRKTANSSLLASRKNIHTNEDEIQNRMTKGLREYEIQQIISKLATPTQIVFDPMENGAYLGISRRSKRDPTRFYEGTSTFMSFTLKSKIRSKIITVVDSTYFEIFILIVIIVNAIFIAADNPISPPSQYIQSLFKIFDIIFLVIYTIEMILKMIALGIINNGIHSYFCSGWNIMDFIVVVLGYISFLPMVNSNFAGIRAVRVLRPLRSINSIPGMKLLVASLLTSISMMGNVLLLCFFMFVFFGLIGMQFFAGRLQQHCYNINTGEINANYTHLCGASDNIAFQCGTNEECLPSGTNPNHGITGFDNIYMSWLTVLQCISLEGWIDIGYMITETTHKGSILFFITLIFTGAFIVINLVVGVIVSAYEIESEKQKALKEKIKNTSLNGVKSVINKVHRSTVAVANIIPQAVNKINTKTNEKDTLFSDICRNIADHSMFDRSIIGLIILNALVLACEFKGEPKEWIFFQEVANYVFTSLFAIEATIKLVGYGISKYFSDQFNRFDFIIIVVNIVEIATVNEGLGLSAFRAMRLIKVFRLARSWTELRDLLNTVVKSLNSLVYFSLVLLLFIFIYALLGMQFFAGKMNDENGELTRANFDTFWWSIVTVFQVIGGENWNDILWITILNTNWLLGVVYCVSLFVLGNYVLLNLFLAILLSNFDFNDVEDIDSDDSLFDIINKANKQTEDSEDSEEKYEQTEESEFEKKTNKDKDIEIYYDPTGYTLVHRDPELKDKIIALFRGQKVILHGKSLVCLSTTNFLRIRCALLVQHSTFEILILLTICFSSIVLIFDTPHLNKNSNLSYFLYYTNIIATTIFCIEAILKIIANGLCFTQSAYLKDTWNIIDILAISFSILDLFIGHLSYFRVLRAFRALRIIRRFDGMRVVTIAMIKSIKPVMNVVAISILFFFVFGILGVQLFKGQFEYCQDINGNDLGLNKTQCTTQYNGDNWRNPAFGDFDHIGDAALVLFEISTLEMWPSVMYRAVDINSIDNAPTRDNNPQYALYFIFFIIATNFFIMNLFVGVVVDHFNSAKNKLEGGLLTKEQEQWVYLKKWIASTGNQPAILRYKKPKIYFEDLSFNYYYQLKQNGSGTIFELVIYYYKIYILYKFRVSIFKFVTNKMFDGFIMFCILLNTLILLTWHYNQTIEMEIFLFFSNKVFTAIFFSECLLKLFGLGFFQYFASKWNVFDFIIVVGSLLMLTLHEMHGSLKMPTESEDTSSGFDPTSFRIFRILRLFRLVQRAKGLKILIQTLIYSLPSLSNIGCLLSLIFFIYGIIGMGLFGGLPHSDDPNSFITIHSNFDNFWNSLITLFRIATGESWNGIMHQVLPKRCTFMNSGVECGTYAAPLYFISFVVIVSFIILNVFIAVILDHFEDAMNEENRTNLSFKQIDVEYFTLSWSAYTPTYKWWKWYKTDHLWMNIEYFEVFLTKTHGVFGLADKNWSRLERFKFLQTVSIPLHKRYNIDKREYGIYINLQQTMLAIGLVVMIKNYGKWVKTQITQQTRFARIAAHRRADWKVAKQLLRTTSQYPNYTLIQILAVLRLQAAARGYLVRKKVRKMYFP